MLAVGYFTILRLPNLETHNGSPGQFALSVRSYFRQPIAEND